ncbi:Sensor protein FixL [Planctomycetes bacterium Poly30]|uniref:histidine kinase n=1 Tax=Saltatorellus ferox TaxID=2528018 RepID=A0A518F1D5_9BACT|nr:Sensor protein FixL [Planctomycetes bacterium Poly30]
MSIRTKLALTLFLAVGLFLGLDMLLLRKMGAGSFELLERSRCEAQVAGIQRAFESAYDELAGLARQASLAVSDTTGLGAPMGEVEAEVELRAIQRAEAMDDADLALTLVEDGVVASYRYRTPKGGDGALREVPNQSVSEAHPFMKAWMSGTPPRGLLETGDGLLLIGSAVGSLGGQPVLHVRGRRLDDSGMTRVQGLAGATFTCRTLREELLTSATGEIPLPGEVQVLESSDEKLTGTALLNDVRGIPAATVTTEVLRNQLQTVLQRQELLTAAGVAILFPLVLLVLIQIVVTGPLGRLTAHASQIGQSNDASQRLNLRRKDEIGVLAAEFDRMLDELDRSRRAQQKIARMSGRSDVATGVMHGVGNLVNSVNVSAQLASDTIAGLGIEDLRAILEALSSHAGDLDRYLAEDPQGQHLLSFFGVALAGIEAKVDGAKNEVSAVVRTVDEVTSLVQSLRSEESHEVVVDRVQLEEEIEAALVRTGIREPGLNIRCRLALQPDLGAFLDQQRLEEILDAVLCNARESLQLVEASSRELNVRATSVDEETFRISVEDSGVGIAQEYLESIFALNATTKGEGRGRGLHMASIGAKELGGELHAWSAGVGEGAILTLDLPVHAATPER